MVLIYARGIIFFGAQKKKNQMLFTNIERGVGLQFCKFGNMCKRKEKVYNNEKKGRSKHVIFWSDFHGVAFVKSKWWVDSFI